MNEHEQKILAKKLEKGVSGLTEVSSALTDVRMNWLNRQDGSAAEVTVLIPRGEYCEGEEYGDCLFQSTHRHKYADDDGTIEYDDYCVYFKEFIYNRHSITNPDTRNVKCKQCQEYCNMGRSL